MRHGFNIQSEFLESSKNSTDQHEDMYGVNDTFVQCHSFINIDRNVYPYSLTEFLSLSLSLSCILVLIRIRCHIIY